MLLFFAVHWDFKFEFEKENEMKFWQGHPTDRFDKLSVRKANFLKGILTSNFRDMGNVRPSVFGLIKMFRVPKKGQLRFSERK